jgi:hypothetical protein
MSRAVVNVAVGGYQGTKGDYYPAHQALLHASLRKAGNYHDDILFWTNVYPQGSASFGELPYHFKPMAMVEAAWDHHVLLWLDAVMLAVHPIEPIFRQIESEGYFLWSNPAAKWSVGEWTSDECLRHYKVDRAAAFDMEMICSGVFGWSLDHPVGKRLHEAFAETPAVALRGSKHNRNNIVSTDRRVQGHRHDQSVLSILMHQQGLKSTPGLVAGISLVDDQTIIVHDPGDTGRPAVTESSNNRRQSRNRRS